MASSPRALALMRIARDHFHNHHKGNYFSVPDAIDAALFVEEVRKCPLCKEALSRLPE